MWRREEERGESEVCSGDAVTPAYVYMCECVNVCLFEKEKRCVFGVWTGLCELVCVCVGVQGEGKGDGAKGEGHNALGEGDQICSVRW